MNIISHITYHSSCICILRKVREMSRERDDEQCAESVLSHSALYRETQSAFSSLLSLSFVSLSRRSKYL